MGGEAEVTPSPPPPLYLPAFFRQPFLWALGVSVAMLALYVRTLMPGPVGGDAGELQYAGPLLTLTHPTGHPLYVLIGYAWSKLMPIGTVAYRLNLLSAVWGALAAGVFTWLTHRLTGRTVIAVAGGLTLGLGATFWGEATLADKYAFNAFFAALVVGLALWWAQDRSQPYGDKLLYALSLSYGLSLLHHRSMALFGPWLALMVACAERQALWRRWKRTLVCLALVCLPALIVYPTLLPWFRDHTLYPNQWRPRNLGEWLDWMADRRAVSTSFVVPGLGEQMLRYAHTVLNDYTAVVVVIALAGLAFLARRQPMTALFVVLSYVPLMMLGANFRDNDRPFTYYLPSLVLVVACYVYGLNALWDVIRGWLKDHQGWQRGLGIALAVGVLALPAYQLAHTYPVRRTMALYGDPLDIWRQILKTGTQGERLASGMADLPPEAVVIGDWEQITILWYAQHIEGVRPDLTLVYPIDALADYAASGREIVLARHLPVDETWHPTNVDALVWLRREPSFDLPTRLIPIGTPLSTPEGAPQLELAGYWMQATTVEAGQHVPLVITWRALADLDTDYSLSLHILDEQWNLIWSRDIGAPVLGMYPTSRWVEGEVVQDYHELDVPREMPPRRYLWTVVVYRQLADGSFEQLRDPGGGIEVLGGTFEVIPRPAW